jgi:hypothetical protein
MSVQVSEEMVDVFRSGGISIPFPDVETEQGFICVGFGDFDETFQVAIKISD